MGRDVAEPTMECIRKLAEQCDSLEGFLLYHSIGGGTGGGVGSWILSMLEEYEKVLKVAFSVFPSPRFSNSVVEPISSLFSCAQLKEHTDMACIYHNEALYNICGYV